MAWVSPRVYAILSKSEEGKDILEGIADKDQKEVDQEVDAFFGKGGKGYNSNAEYSQAKIDDEAEENDGEDFHSPDSIAKRYQKIEDAFDMPKEEGWEPSDSGEKSFIKNKDKDNEMFIQYNGADYDGDNQEWVAGYMRNGGYVSKKFATMEDAKDFLNNGDNEYSKKESKKLDDIIKERSTFTKDKDYDAYSFKKELENNGYKVDYVENRSGTWQDHDGEKFKEYDIKLESGQHIYFKLIADENYDTKEIVAYKNGKNW